MSENMNLRWRAVPFFGPEGATEWKVQDTQAGDSYFHMWRGEDRAKKYAQVLNQGDADFYGSEIAKVLPAFWREYLALAEEFAEWKDRHDVVVMLHRMHKTPNRVATYIMSLAQYEWAQEQAQEQAREEFAIN